MSILQELETWLSCKMLADKHKDMGSITSIHVFKKAKQGNVHLQSSTGEAETGRASVAGLERIKSGRDPVSKGKEETTGGDKLLQPLASPCAHVDDHVDIYTHMQHPMNIPGI